MHLDHPVDPSPALDAASRIEEAARAILDASTTGKPVALLTETLPDLTVDVAYAIQEAQIERRRAAGARLVGYKVGLTSAALRRRLGAGEPDYGHLLDDDVCAEPGPIETGRLFQPRVEPELAFVLGDQLVGPGVTEAAAACAVEAVVPALEIVDSRLAGAVTLCDAIADNALLGGAVLGARSVPLGGIDLSGVGCRLALNGEVVETATGAAVLGSPLRAVVWLANALARRGAALERGHVVLSGAFTSPAPVGPGDVVEASFTGLGEVAARFSPAAGRDRRPA